MISVHQQEGKKGGWINSLLTLSLKCLGENEGEIKTLECFHTTQVALAQMLPVTSTSHVPVPEPGQCSACAQHVALAAVQYPRWEAQRRAQADILSLCAPSKIAISIIMFWARGCELKQPLYEVCIYFYKFDCGRNHQGHQELLLNNQKCSCSFKALSRWLLCQ